MKTAMQLMLWYLENEGLEQSGAYYKAKMLLEKEKEQIDSAFKASRNIQDSDDISITYDWVNASEYYNQTYNQNK
jgi:hypothetical protein